MAGGCNRAGALWLKPQRDTRGKAAFQPPAEAAVEDLEECRRRGILLCQRADCTHDERDCHGGFETFAAYVSQNNEGRLSVDGNDLEEVTSHFERRLVRTGQAVSGELSACFGDE